MRKPASLPALEPLYERIRMGKMIDKNISRLSGELPRGNRLQLGEFLSV
jgi:hypothetical protein